MYKNKKEKKKNNCDSFAGHSTVNVTRKGKSGAGELENKRDRALVRVTECQVRRRSLEEHGAGNDEKTRTPKRQIKREKRRNKREHQKTKRLEKSKRHSVGSQVDKWRQDERIHPTTLRESLKSGKKAEGEGNKLCLSCLFLFLSTFQPKRLLEKGKKINRKEKWKRFSLVRFETVVRYIKAVRRRILAKKSWSGRHVQMGNKWKEQNRKALVMRDDSRCRWFWPQSNEWTYVTKTLVDRVFYAVRNPSARAAPAALQKAGWGKTKPWSWI